AGVQLEDHVLIEEERHLHRVVVSPETDAPAIRIVAAAKIGEVERHDRGPSDAARPGSVLRKYSRKAPNTVKTTASPFRIFTRNDASSHIVQTRAVSKDFTDPNESLASRTREVYAGRTILTIVQEKPESLREVEGGRRKLGRRSRICPPTSISSAKRSSFKTPRGTGRRRPAATRSLRTGRQPRARSGTSSRASSSATT